jgi:hypothetical protein
MTLRLKRALLAVAIAGVQPASAVAGGSELKLSVGDASFWVEQSEEAAEKAVPTGYQLVDRQRGTWWGSWWLRREAGAAHDEPYFIRIETAHRRVARVHLEWPSHAHVTTDSLFTALARTFGDRQDCRVSSHVDDRCAASGSTTLDFACGKRHLTATFGWGHGTCAATGLTLE